MEDYKKALDYSFLLLKHRARSRGEIIDRLRKRKFSLSVINSVLDSLQQSGYVDDDDFAASFVREKLGKGFGLKRISFDLKRLKLSDEVIDKSFSAIDRSSYLNGLSQLANERFRRYQGSKDLYGKVFRYLVQRGFSPDEIRKVIDESG